VNPFVRLVRPLDWVAPLDVARGLALREGVLCLLSDGGPNGRHSYVACEPDQTVVARMEEDQPFAAFAEMRPDVFVVGLAAYDAGARPATGDRGRSAGDWPDLLLGAYRAMLVFDHETQALAAVGLGRDETEAGLALDRASDWVSRAGPRDGTPPVPARSFDAQQSDQAYRDAVADVVARIGAGELFQANIARGWQGGLKPDAGPFAVFDRLAGGPAPYGAFWRMGDRALVSNSPELFLTFDPDDGRIETRPIKGTRPRHADAERDAASAAELVSSAKDRAENLMIVDLMRNDLSRVATPGTVVADRLFALESFATVHHLVSTVTGQAAEGVGAAEILSATFPAGSITGAPKHQAMRVIAGHETPRGPWCGTLFLRDETGALTASVLIRTISFWKEDERWRFRTLAGAGIVADSDPASEFAETDAKIAAVRHALIG
jgi:para-aminobenzoate synthetase component 1